MSLKGNDRQFFYKIFNKRIQTKKAFVRTIFKSNKEVRSFNMLKAKLNYALL